MSQNLIDNIKQNIYKVNLLITNTLWISIDENQTSGKKAKFVIVNTNICLERGLMDFGKTYNLLRTNAISMPTKYASPTAREKSNQ